MAIEIGDFNTCITTLAKEQASLTETLKAAPKAAKGVIKAQIIELELGANTLAKANVGDGLTAPEEETEAKPEVRVVPSKDFDLALADVKASRLKEIEAEIKSIPKIAKTGTLDIPEITTGTAIYLHGRANEIYVKLEVHDDE